MGLYRHIKRRGHIVFIFSGLIIITLAYYFLIEPLIQKNNALNSEIAAQELRRGKNLRAMEQLKNVNKRYREYVELMRLKYSDEQEMANILTGIESVAQEIKIRLLDIKPQKVKTLDFYKEFGIDLIVEGQLNDLALFIYNLENLPYLLRVDKLRIEKGTALQSNLKSYLQVSKVLMP